MNNQIRPLAVGKKVWWSDPDNDLSSGVYEVVEVRTDEDGCFYDDTIILIASDTSEAEVQSWELQDLTIRQNTIKALVDKITEIAEEEGWNVHNYDEDFNEIELEFSKYSSAGQDFSCCISAKSGERSDFLDEFDNYIDGYDPDYEATLWAGDDGHGKNGAPYRLSDIIKDMEECKENMQDLYQALFKGLK